MILLIDKTTKTTMGITSPWTSHISISFMLESSGSFSCMVLCRVYITRFDVSATIIIVSKCDSSMKSAISAARTRQIVGMKRDIQKGAESLRRSMNK